jgi:hypothetical protein
MMTMFWLLTPEEYQELPNNVEKSCSTCKWHSLVHPHTGIPALSRELAFCTNPKQGNSFVTGEMRVGHCYWHRNNKNVRLSCNGRAHWWEAKEQEQVA